VGVAVEPPHVAERYRRKLGSPFTFLSDYRYELADALGVPTLRAHPLALLRFSKRGLAVPAIFVFDASGARRFTWIQELRLGDVYHWKHEVKGRLRADGLLGKLRQLAAGRVLTERSGKR
jgi:hypothetical protein